MVRRTFSIRARWCLAALCFVAGSLSAEVAAQDFPLFVADYRGIGVYRLDASGNLTDIAFVPGLLNTVRDDSAGNLYTCSEDKSDVSRIDPAGTVSVFASGFAGCFGLLLRQDGTLYVSNLNAGRIEAVPPAGGSFTTFASGLSGPAQMAFEADGSILVNEFFAGRLSRVDRDGQVTVVAAGLARPFGLAVQSGGDIYVSEVLSGRILRIDAGGNVAPFLGLGAAGPTGLDFDQHGRLFIAQLFAGSIVVADVNTADVSVFRDNLEAPAGLHFQRQFVVRVTVDVKPGSDLNPLNPASKGVVPVAVLSTDTFDATAIDSSSVRFGVTGTEAAAAQTQVEDVDGDGRLDLVFQFPTNALGIPAASPAGSVVTLKLTGKTSDGQAIEGQDGVRITPSKQR